MENFSHNSIYRIFLGMTLGLTAFTYTGCAKTLEDLEIQIEITTSIPVDIQDAHLPANGSIQAVARIKGKSWNLDILDKEAKGIINATRGNHVVEISFLYSSPDVTNVPIATSEDELYVTETNLIFSGPFELPDEDGDGFSNLDEIQNHSLPNDKTHIPAPVLDIVYKQGELAFSWNPLYGLDHYQIYEYIGADNNSSDLSAPLYPDAVSFEYPVNFYEHDWQNRKYLIEACFDQYCAQSEKKVALDALLSSAAYIKSSNSEAGDRFGRFMALSDDGNTLAVSAYYESGAGSGINNTTPGPLDNMSAQSGAVYIYRRIDDVWMQADYIKASNTGSGDEFGYSVALSGNGNVLAVGAQGESSAATGVNPEPGQDDDTVESAGAVYVFEYDGESWAQKAYVKASRTAAFDNFGRFIDLSKDGLTLGVGALDTSNSGAVFVFRDTGTAWEQQAYLKASNAENEDFFGWSLALSATGNTLAIGADSESSAATGVNDLIIGQDDNNSPNAGAVYIFRFINDTWEQTDYIKASNSGDFDYFGTTIDISDDGNILAIGASGEDSATAGVNNPDPGPNDDSLIFSGAVYLFGYTDSVWKQQAYIKASNPGESDYFGKTLALNSDGTVLAVGANLEDGGIRGIDSEEKVYGDKSADSGAAYLFRFSAADGWKQQSYIKATNTGDNDLFGTSVELSSDAATIAVGAWGESSAAKNINNKDPGQNDDNAYRSGAVYIYQK